MPKNHMSPIEWAEQDDVRIYYCWERQMLERRLEFIERDDVMVYSILLSESLCETASNFKPPN